MPDFLLPGDGLGAVQRLQQGVHLTPDSLNFSLELPGREAQHTGAKGGELNQAVGGGDPDPVVLADSPDQGLNLHIAGFVFPGVYHKKIVVPESFAPVAFHLIAVEN